MHCWRRRRIGSITVALLLAATAALAQPEMPADFTDEKSLPDGRRGERIRQVLAAVSSGDPAQIEALAKDAFGGPFAAIPIEQHQQALGAWYDRSRGLDFHAVRRSAVRGAAERGAAERVTPERVEVIARNRLTEGWQTLVVTFDDTPEARITGLQLLPAPPPKDAPAAPSLTVEPARAELEAFVDRLAAAEAFSGTALLARNGEVVFEAARGMAERNHGVPMRLDSKLNLGSMGKMFTAVVIAQLAEEGRLSFQDPVSKFLDGKGWTKADLAKVRIEHLLSHTSGLGSYFNETFLRTARQRFRRIEDYRPLVAEETLAFEPGARWQYSNTGFLLLGAVIEAVTGKDYFDAVRERVYARAGMPDSDSYDVDLVVPRLAIGYSRERTAKGVQWRANTFEHVIRGGPAGGGYSTARDMLAFAEALRKGKLVSAATLATLMSPKPELHSPSYGFGFGVGQDQLGRGGGHTGGFPGIASGLDVYLDTGWTVVVLTNDGSMPAVSQKLREVAGRIH